MATIVTPLPWNLITLVERLKELYDGSLDDAPPAVQMMAVGCALGYIRAMLDVELLSLFTHDSARREMEGFRRQGANRILWEKKR